MAWWKIQQVDSPDGRWVSILTDIQQNTQFEITYDIQYKQFKIHMMKKNKKTETIYCRTMEDLLERTKLIFKIEDRLQLQQAFFKAL